MVQGAAAAGEVEDKANRLLRRKEQTKRISLIVVFHA